MTDSGNDPAPDGAPGGSPGGTPQPPEGGGGDLSGFDRAINDLHSRIADLRVSVDDMGPGGAPPAQPTYPSPPGAEQPPPAYPSPAYEPYAAPPPGGAYASPSAYGPPPTPPPPAYPPPYPEPPPAPAYYEEPDPAAAPYFPPDQGDVYGVPVEPTAPHEGSDALGTFFRVDVGPFEDLLAMTAFEEQLSALPSMADVRVRRFAVRRAEIELEMLGTAPLAREVRRVAPEAETGVQPDGTLTVELHDERWTGGIGEPAIAEEPEPADPAATAETEQGDDVG